MVFRIFNCARRTFTSVSLRENEQVNAPRRCVVECVSGWFDWRRPQYSLLVSGNIRSSSGITPRILGSIGVEPSSVMGRHSRVEA